jgi:hypothetical protein
MSELSAFAGSEVQGAGDDEGGLGSAPTSSKPPGPAKREPDGFSQVYIHLPCLPVTYTELARSYNALGESITVTVNE